MAKSSRSRASRSSGAPRAARKAFSSRDRGKRAGALGAASRSLRAFALALPGATEDFPWGERVAKVHGKVFVFLGIDPVPGGDMGMSVKLPASKDEALDLPFTKPTGYGLGKSGWVSATFGPSDEPPVDILKAWIEESYRAVAPKRLVAELDPGKRAVPRRPSQT